jgi:hypothetical protein
MSTLRVIHADIAAIKFCNRGARMFFDRHGLDWGLFMREGIDADVLAKLGDEMGLKAIQQAKRRTMKEATSGR